MTQKNATYIIIHKSLTNCDIALIFQVFKVDLLHETLKPSVCQNGLVNSRKTFCAETYFEIKSLCAVQRCFRRKFQCRHYPDKRLIHWWAQKFREHGTVLDLNAKDKRDIYSGRPKSARSQENIDAIRDSIGQSPRKSLQRGSQAIGINREFKRRTLVKDLQLYPYRIQIKHKLTQADMEKHVAMCCWFCDKVDENPDFLDDLWFSDEAHFLLSDHVNSKNIFWGSTPPEDCLQRHYIPLNVQPGLPYQNMESLSHTGSRTKVKGQSWSTLSTTLKCYRNFGQHWDDEEALREMVSGFSRMVLPLTLQMKLCNGSDEVLEIASSVGGVKSSKHHIHQNFHKPSRFLSLGLSQR